MVPLAGQLCFCSMQSAFRKTSYHGTNGAMWLLHPSTAGAVCLFPPMPCYHKQQPAASQRTEILSKKLFWTVQQKNPNFIIFRPQMQAVHDVWLPSPSVSTFSQIFILNRKHFHDLISLVQGEWFSAQAAHVSAVHTLGWEKTLPLITLEGYLGLKWEGGFIRESPAPWAVSSTAFLIATPSLWVLGLFPDGVKVSSVGSPYFRVAFQVEKNLFSSVLSALSLLQIFKTYFL